MAVQQWVDEVITQISKWDGVAVNPHRFGGREFNMGKVEIGHIHRSGMVDIPFTRRIREALVENGLAKEHHLLKDSGWVSYYLRSDADVQHALWLYRFSWLHKQRGRARRNPERLATLDADLRAMNPGKTLLQATGIS